MTGNRLLRAVVRADSRGQRLYLTDAESADEAQASGRWIETDDSVDLRSKR